MSEPLEASNPPTPVFYSTPKMSFMHKVRVVISALLLIFWCVFMLLVNVIWRMVSPSTLEKSYFIFHGGCCRLFNLSCRVQGEISANRPTLFLSNHVSYLDVFILGRYIPAFFIAKSEVSAWPILGWLAKVQNTLFFERSSKKVRHQMDIMTRHFNQRGNLILFPEGTSTNGEYVKPFKSSLLQSAELADSDVWIQPVSLAYTRYQQKMMDQPIRDQYAWYDKMPFASHFFNALGLRQAEVEVLFHPPVKLDRFESRKQCAQYCQEQVATGLSQSLSE